MEIKSTLNGKDLTKVLKVSTGLNTILKPNENYVITLDTKHHDYCVHDSNKEYQFSDILSSEEVESLQDKLEQVNAIVV